MTRSGHVGGWDGRDRARGKNWRARGRCINLFARRGYHETSVLLCARTLFEERRNRRSRHGGGGVLSFVKGEGG